MGPLFGSLGADQESTCSLPGPWHFSHWTPSRIEKVSSFSQPSASAAVAWHPRQSGDLCGSIGTPLIAAMARASGVGRLA